MDDLNCGGKWAEEPEPFSRLTFSFPFFSFDSCYFKILGGVGVFFFSPSFGGGGKGGGELGGG